MVLNPFITKTKDKEQSVPLTSTVAFPVSISMWVSESDFTCVNTTQDNFYTFIMIGTVETTRKWLGWSPHSNRGTVETFIPVIRSSFRAASLGFGGTQNKGILTGNFIRTNFKHSSGKYQQWDSPHQVGVLCLAPTSVAAVGWNQCKPVWSSLMCMTENSIAWV